MNIRTFYFILIFSLFNISLSYSNILVFKGLVKLNTTDLQSLTDIDLNKENISSSTTGKDREVIEECLQLLDSGEARVSEKIEKNWVVNEWLKKAVLLSFRLWPMDLIPGGPGNSNWWDKVPSKFSKWDKNIQ